MIGSGTAASGVATAVRRAGWSVALADFRPLGGTCALRGCDPKRVLTGAAEALDFAARLQRRGLSGEPRIDWPALMSFKREFTEPVPGQSDKRWRDAGIEVLHGRARFVGRTRVDVAGRDIEARHIVLAIGAEPVQLEIRGAPWLTTSEQFLDLPTLPARIVFVGGGYIAAELSHLAARAGAKVTVLQRGERMLKTFDPDLVAKLCGRMRSRGIDLQLQTRVEAIEEAGGALRVCARQGDREISLDADLVVHAAGRRPDFEALNLPAAGIDLRDRRLDLDEHLRSRSNPAVYAAGDAAQQGPPLTPVASLDAEVVAENLLHGDRRQPDYRGVPSVAFSLPPIAAVGLGEEPAHRQGLQFRTHFEDASSWYTARRVGETLYAFKTLIEQGSNRLLGAHLVGPAAEETINLFALAIRNGWNVDTLKSAVYAYPTAASDIASML